jgi:hypothetical protein
MMSGEQTTSLFNALLNHWLFEYAEFLNNFKGADAVEGDDGCFGVPDDITAQDFEQLYATIGFSIKVT